MAAILRVKVKFVALKWLSDSAYRFFSAKSQFLRVPFFFYSLKVGLFRWGVAILARFWSLRKKKNSTIVGDSTEIKWMTDWLTDWLIVSNWLTNWLPAWLTDWLIVSSCLTDWPWPTDSLTDWSIDWLVVSIWLTDRLTEGSKWPGWLTCVEEVHRVSRRDRRDGLIPRHF